MRTLGDEMGELVPKMRELADLMEQPQCLRFIAQMEPLIADIRDQLSVWRPVKGDA